jgi:hypothetical protein
VSNGSFIGPILETGKGEQGWVKGKKNVQRGWLKEERCTLREAARRTCNELTTRVGGKRSLDVRTFSSSILSWRPKLDTPLLHVLRVAFSFHPHLQRYPISSHTHLGLFFSRSRAG